MGKKDGLRPELIIQTLERLQLRIRDRFPTSGLSRVCDRVLTVARGTNRQIAWIERPNWLLRLLVIGVIVVVAAVLVSLVSGMNLKLGHLSFVDVANLIDTTINELVLITAALVFLIGIEVRVKRRKVVRCISRLRCLAHIIDAHQLTKDPNIAPHGKGDTTHSPERTLSAYELNRYLDYCSEILALLGKIGFLYVQNFHDPVAVESVNDLEVLTTGMARKIWQKIMILDTKAPGWAQGD